MQTREMPLKILPVPHTGYTARQVPHQRYPNAPVPDELPPQTAWKKYHK